MTLYSDRPLTSKPCVPAHDRARYAVTRRARNNFKNKLCRTGANPWSVCGTALTLPPHKLIVYLGAGILSQAAAGPSRPEVLTVQGLGG